MTCSPTIIPFAQKLDRPLYKTPITTLQINLGRKCNLACNHCHVEAGPQRTEELSPVVCDQLIAMIRRFPQIRTVDLTGGAPEMNYGFRPLVAAAREAGKEILVRSNLTVFFIAGYEDLPAYFAANGVRVVASLPCYLEDNVNRQRGQGVYGQSIQALQRLNALGYGTTPGLILDLVYNPPIPRSPDFRLTPDQHTLQRDYKTHLRHHFGIEFNHLLTITNLPIGRVKDSLEKQQLHDLYVAFLEAHHNPATVANLMCRSQLSVDYLGNVFDCDFNQMALVFAGDHQGKKLTIGDFLAADSLDLIDTVKTANFCYGCTAGSGSSCGGALVD